MLMELDTANIADYLYSRGQLTRDEIRSGTQVSVLEGGVSNLTMLVRSVSRSLVVKQALGRLKVREEWFASRSRIFRESAAIQAFSSVLDPGQVPELIFTDESEFIIGIEEVEHPSVVWQSLITAGDVSAFHAFKAGQVLARMHGAVPSKRDAELLSDLRHVEELRIQPYFERAAEGNPSWQARFAMATERVLTEQSALVHGDYAPKNIFVRPDDPYVTVLDFEVTHVGNPSFDIAFFLSHLVIDALHAPGISRKITAAALQFWVGYQRESKLFLAAQLERDTALLLPCLLLARVDGLSTVDYLSVGGVDAVKNTAYRLLEENNSCIHSSLDSALHELDLQVV